VLKKAKICTPPPQVILVSAHGDIPIAVQAMNEGAYGFIEKPLDLNHFRAQVNRAAERAAAAQAEPGAARAAAEQSSRDRRQERGDAAVI
jgi:FixJ family two-component response regulator